MTGWLIVNEYLNTDKFRELRDLFLKAAEAKSVNLSVYTNADFVVDFEMDVISEAFDKGRPEFILFYDKDLVLARAFESMGLSVYNSSDAIEICDSKALTAECVAGKVRTPRTFKVPFTYENIGIHEESSWKFLDLIEKEIACGSRDVKSAYPLIIKESHSSFGMGVHLANSRDEAISLIIKHGSKECLIQEYIEYAKGTDVRLQMVGDTCVAAMMRKNDDDYRANLTNGGVMTEYVPSNADIEMAAQVMKSLELDFAGIDIMHDEKGEPIFCEANSNAHFKNLYDLTGINAAEFMFDYIRSNLKPTNE